jgi:CRP-like cAMP-binding protein
VASSGYERVLVLEVLSKIEPFAGCDKQELGLVADAVVGRTTVAAGDDLCVEGDVAEQWWVVVGGRADVASGGVKVGSVTTNEAVGELSLFDDSPRSATVTAAEPLDVLIFDKSTFVAAIGAAPSLALALLRSASRRLRATNALV